MGHLRTVAEAHAFSLRLWREYVGAGTLEWRGRLQYLPTGESMYFRDWETLVSQLRALLAGADGWAAGPEYGGAHAPADSKDGSGALEGPGE
ncbi:MAG TPA: hypothetical protein VKX16_10280 [Chloroflexota bacterium]|nr:hypothetical protein [Chloroflexota bacterium]